MQRRTRNVRRVVYAFGARALVGVLKWLPFSVLRGLCRLLVVPVARLQFSRLADRQLREAFGDELDLAARRRVRRLMFRNLADIPAEILAWMRQGDRFLLERFGGGDGPAQERFRAVQQRSPRGVIAVTGHCGNWELLLQYVHRCTARPVGGAVAKRIPNPRLNAVVDRMRGRAGVPTLYRDTDTAAMLRALRDNMTLGMVPDQDIVEVAGTFVEFFGRPAYTPLGPARLALAAHCPILPAFSRRTEDGHLALEVGEPIWPDTSAPREHEMQRLTREWSRQLEDFVRAHPEQWIWFHERWQTKPEHLRGRETT